MDDLNKKEGDRQDIVHLCNGNLPVLRRWKYKIEKKKYFFHLDSWQC